MLMIHELRLPSAVANSSSLCSLLRASAIVLKGFVQLIVETLLELFLVHIRSPFSNDLLARGRVAQVH
jgi:hypothetical protein